MTTSINPLHRIAALFAISLVLSGMAAAANPNPRIRPSERIEASYAAGEIANVAIDTEYGQVFFDAGKERYVWELKVENLADKLQAAFAVVDRLGHASRVDVSRWPPAGNGRPARAIYHQGLLYYCVDGLDLIFRSEPR